MSFALDIRHWPTVDKFVEHLHQHDPAICNWATEVVYHHTAGNWWEGRKSIEYFVEMYKGYAWNSGPHLFVGPDGIWQMTPLNVPGIHANAANSRSWGIEVVGLYDKKAWPLDIGALAVGAGAALLHWRGLDVSRHSVTPHRRYNQHKSCPGRAINMDMVRVAVHCRKAASL
jgi:N-acetylmuramoyl-L-alanine amidase CwlA